MPEQHYVYKKTHAMYHRQGCSHWASTQQDAAAKSEWIQHTHARHYDAWQLMLRIIDRKLFGAAALMP